jgi:hypothetical protein
MLPVSKPAGLFLEIGSFCCQGFIGSYEVLEKIGEGRFAQVRLVRSLNVSDSVTHTRTG